MNKQLSIVLAAMVISVSIAAHAADFALIKDGKPVLAVVVRADAPKPVRHAAEELSAFLAKIAVCEKIKVSESADKTLYNVYLATLDDQALVKESGLEANKIKFDGFGIAANDKGLYIIGGSPLGALYGSYEILKKYGGIRWLTPRADGEYFTVKKDISVPEQLTYRNPYLVVRRNSGASMEWAARNYLQPYGGMGPYRKPEDTIRADNNAYQASYVAGHIMTWLLADGHWGNSKEGKAILEKMFKEHPEYFPLVGGKRTMMGGAGSPNPCVGNPVVLDKMAETFVRISLIPNANSDYITIGNNDTTAWCECEECRKLDNPAMAGTKGQRSDRYWYAVNEIAKRVWQKNPNAKIRGWAYQDFWYPPTKVKIDPRIAVIISFNNQCWRHAITDPQCSINAELLKIYHAWSKLGLPLINNRDEITADGSAGSLYLPCERVLYQNCKDYPALGCNGTRFCSTDPVPATLSWTKDSPFFYGKNYSWDAMWQTDYMTAQFLFDIDQDFDGMYEEINGLYYGKGWAGGMREFNALRTKAFVETPGCIGWGSGAPLGRCLDQTGVEQKLKELIIKAETAAASDPDPRALAHVRRDKEIFELTWVTARKNYVENFRELTAYTRTAPIKIDGVLDEVDWKNADVMNTFKTANWRQKKDLDNLAKIQTYVRVVYEQDYLYIAVECLEPTPGLLSHQKSERDEWPSGNKVEIFFNYPDMAEKYYQYCFNTAGAFYDSLVRSISDKDKSYDGKAEYAVKIDADRWILEARFPTSAIGMKCFDGATWKLNVARGRSLSDGTSEQSSCANGQFHGADNFVNVKFAPKRGEGLGGQSRDPAAWKNSSFNAVTKNTIKGGRNKGAIAWPAWTGDIPADWGAPEGKTAGCLKLYENSTDNYYIELTAGILAQWYVAPPVGKLKLIFKASGNGELAVWSEIAGTPLAGSNGYPAMKVNKTQTFKVESAEWKAYAYEIDYKEGTRVLFRIYHKKGVVNLDDAIAVPSDA